MCFDFVWNISDSEKNSVRYCHKIFIYLHVKYPSFLSYFKETCLSSTDIHMSYFHENLSSGSQVIPYGWMDRQTDMMKLIDVFKTFVNMPKNVHFHELSLHVGPSLGIWYLFSCWDFLLLWTQIFMTVFTRDSHWTVSLAISVWFIYPCPFD